MEETSVQNDSDENIHYSAKKSKINEERKGGEPLEGDDPQGSLKYHLILSGLKHAKISKDFAFKVSSFSSDTFLKALKQLII